MRGRHRVGARTAGGGRGSAGLVLPLVLAPAEGGRTGIVTAIGRVVAAAGEGAGAGEAGKTVARRPPTNAADSDSFDTRVSSNSSVKKPPEVTHHSNTTRVFSENLFLPFMECARGPLTPTPPPLPPGAAGREPRANKRHFLTV